MTAAKSYKDTVNLPKTNFEMRANAAKRELQLQQFWADNKIYEKLSQQDSRELFILHDGPPYANGPLHMGHALNKTLKDIINKYQLLKGRAVRYIPGWDCHGLPIELKVLQEIDPKKRAQLTPLEIRQQARDFALKTIDNQREGFKRFGIWGDWDDPYLTLKPEYEAAQIGVFGQMALKGYIYRGLKSVHWSPSSKTALAEAELEYPDNHVSDSIYAAFPMTKLSATVEESLEPYLEQLGVAIWTTTPWTIPANLAVAVNSELTYAVVEIDGEICGFRYLLVALDLVEKLTDKFGVPLDVKAKIKGKDLEFCYYQHPLFERESPIIIGGDYITTESGTGLVHTAPGHGQEDFIVGQRYGLPILSPVDENGNFTAEAGEFAGLNVLKNANAAIITALKDKGSLLKEEPYNHKYPYDWRTKKPTIFRATEQWFASVDQFREAALKAISEVEWIPEQGINRITAMVSERSDWCISRQRSWGVPIPVFYEEETGEYLLTEETISHIQELFAEFGSDAWWEFSVEDLLPEKYHNNGKTYRKGTDTMDVWFDSGSSWAGVAQQRPGLCYPVDMYLEGSDQHRGWFQSSLLTSVANNGIAPYKTVLTHGFVLDEQGRKMSKSLGNVLDPLVIINGGKDVNKEPAYGADVLRLWVSSVDYSSDVLVGNNIIKQLAEVYRKIRNTARFLLGNLHDFDPAKDAVPYEELPDLDKYMLHRITEVFEEVTAAFDSYEFFRFFQTIQNFCVVDLSNFYLDIAKDRLYISTDDAQRRRSCQTVLAIALENLTKAIAPVLCHMAEDIWQNIPYPVAYQSVFESGWVKLDPQWKQPEIGETWKVYRKVRAEVNKVLEKARNDKAIGSSLEAKVLLYAGTSELRQQLEQLQPQAVEPEVKTDDSVVETLAESFIAEAATGEPVTPNSIESNPKSYLNLAIEVLNDLPKILGTLTATYQQPLVVTLLIVSAIATVYILGAVVGAVNEVPLAQPFFEAVGIGYSLWFSKRYLLQAETRQELSAQISETKQTLMGTQAQTSTIQQAVILEEGQEIVVTATPATTTLTPSTPPAPTLTNGVDELRYLLLTSQVELIDTPDVLNGLQYSQQSENLGIGVIKADGEKCDRCWNYSTYVSLDPEQPEICERCISALAGEF